MSRACAPALLALSLAALALAASPAAAQNSTFGETQLNGTGPVYKKQDSLDPVRQVLVVLYISPPGVAVSALLLGWTLILCFETLPGSCR